MRRRFHIVPFAHVVPEPERDQELPEKLRAEWGGILQWAIEGCATWQRVGLNPPPSVVGATEKYFAGEDAQGRWIEETCLTGKEFTARTAHLFESWSKWADRAREFVGTEQRFAQSLEQRGFERWRNNLGRRGFLGLGIK